MNRIVIRVTAIAGEGGITKDKPFRIFTDNASVELSGAWKYKIGAAASSNRPSEYFFSRRPIGNYNAIAAPILKYPIKGVIWYQGESNADKPLEYSNLFKLMINNWRKKNGKIFPFIFVQLPIFGAVSDNEENSGWALLREAQASALELPQTGMAAALDLGEWNDLHPINKKDVGLRLFLAAEKLLNNAENNSPGPMIKKQKTENMEKVYIHFNNCGKGLTTKKPLREENSGIACVTVTGEDGKHCLPVKIESVDSVSVDISSVKKPEKILYAWADNPQNRQLYNSEGFPMIPFRIKL